MYVLCVETRLLLNLLQKKTKITQLLLFFAQFEKKYV